MASKPKNLKQIQDAVRFHRAKERCECSGLWGCTRKHGASRCPSVHGITPPRWKHPVNLAVMQIRGPEDWSPEALVALCQECYKDVAAWRKKQDEVEAQMKARAAESDSMFPELTPIEPRNQVRHREEN
jgi:hypothetical protein